MQNRLGLFLSGVIVTTIFSTAAFARLGSGEPSFCDPAKFSATYEVKNENMKGIKNGHVFRIGGLTLVGLAVGDSDFNSVASFATHHSAVTATDKYCTWYVNNGNSQAEAGFSHEYLNKPGKDTTKSVQEYLTKFGPHLDANSINMVKCAQDYGYIALGCTGMKHRGPSAFGMLLAYAGCSATNAAKIVNTIWGLNGVPEAGRLAVIQAGYDLGRSHSEASSKLTDLLLGTNK